MPISKKLKQTLEKQQYRFIGDNSAVKICEWAKQSLRNQGFCYKQKFYGIRSHLCCQMSTTVNVCQNQCIFCWREMEFNTPLELKKSDILDDKFIDKAIETQRKLLIGFYGSKNANKKKLDEAKFPVHFAISLTGEPTSDKKLPELIKKLHKRRFTTFVVSNGMFPEQLKKIVPTQLYLSLDAPDKETFLKIDRPKLKDAWKRLMKSLDIIKINRKKTRTCVRITLIKDFNMIKPEEYAKLIKKASPHFVEVKAYMWVGSSRLRLKKENMPTHEEVKKFAKEICNSSSYKIIDQKKESRVVLLARKDYPWRKMKF